MLVSISEIGKDWIPIGFLEKIKEKDRRIQSPPSPAACFSVTLNPESLSLSQDVSFSLRYPFLKGERDENNKWQLKQELELRNSQGGFKESSLNRFRFSNINRTEPVFHS